jgi:prepilin-type N-terminal cleavage/methylation domain-containing protein/prepilin-type processing-associated H-X9-DG protein
MRQTEKSREGRPFGGRQGGLGFTLIELLVVVAVVALAGVSLLPALARSKPTTTLSVCRNNLRQLGLAAMLYVGDNKDIFPACSSRNTYGFQTLDWIYWRTSFPAFPLQNSLILAPLGKANTNMFRCPADRDNTDRIILGVTGGPDGAYNASYTMTSYDPVTSQNVYGMASIFGSITLPFSYTSIHRPSGKIMFAEEQSVYQGPECSDPTAGILNDGRWMPMSDALTSRHYGKANVGFTDGHMQAVDWKFGRDPANSRADL